MPSLFHQALRAYPESKGRRASEEEWLIELSTHPSLGGLHPLVAYRLLQQGLRLPSFPGLASFSEHLN